MTPFIMIVAGKPEKPIYSEAAPVVFKNAATQMSLIPMTDDILSGERGFYTEEEIAERPDIIKTAHTTMVKNKLRKSEEGHISIRSAKNDNAIPCCAVFMTKPETVFKALNIDISKYYIIFITHDECLLIDSKNKISEIRKEIASMRNKIVSIYGKDESPILATEVFTYDREQKKYIEV